MGAPQCNLNYCVFFLLLLLMKHVLRHVLKKKDERQVLEWSARLTTWYNGSIVIYTEIHERVN